MTQQDLKDVRLINEFIEDLGDLTRLFRTGDVAEAEHWVQYLRKRWNARNTELITGERAHEMRNP
jgi:hypothetical protein